MDDSHPPLHDPADAGSNSDPTSPEASSPEASPPAPSLDAPPSATLAEALQKQQIELPDDQIRRLDDYCQALWRWNEKLNLTRHTDYDRFVTRDVVDSWQLARLLSPNERILDVGTGGGVPGVIVAILRPDVKVSLSESVAKKARAVDAIVKEIRLPIAVHAMRAEKVLDQNRFHSVVVRAVGPLTRILTWLNPYWGSFGRLLAIKGPSWTQERGEARHLGLLQDLELRIAVSYPMPGTDSQSVILKIWPSDG